MSPFFHYRTQTPVLVRAQMKCAPGQQHLSCDRFCLAGGNSKLAWSGQDNLVFAVSSALLRVHVLMQ